MNVAAGGSDFMQLMYLIWHYFGHTRKFNGAVPIWLSTIVLNYSSMKVYLSLSLLLMLQIITIIQSIDVLNVALKTMFNVYHSSSRC